MGTEGPGQMPMAAIRRALDAAQLSATVDREFSINDYRPTLRCRYPIGEAAAVGLGIVGVAASDLLCQRTGVRAEVSVDYPAASLSLQSCMALRLNGVSPFMEYVKVPISTAGLFVCRDGSWISIAGTEDHHRERILSVLGCDNDRGEVATAISGWRGVELEDAMARADAPATLVRTASQWSRHEQGRALGGWPAVSVRRVGDGDLEDSGSGVRPLEGVRVLDLSRVLAGPTCARLLAEYGAQVLHLSNPNRPEPLFVFLDTSTGKRDASFDLDAPGALDSLHELAAEADVIVTSVRSSARRRRGFDLESLLRRRPGLIYVSINTYGLNGPWEDRPGYEVMAHRGDGTRCRPGQSERPRAGTRHDRRLRHRLPRCLRNDGGSAPKSA